MRAAFDAQVRRKTRADEPGAVVETDAGVLRWLVAETAATDCDVKLPDGVRLDLVTDTAGVEAMMTVNDLAFTKTPVS